jgi:ribosome recycling factor
MNPYIDQKKAEFSEVTEHFRSELSHVRSGQANPELLDGIKVEAYESMMPLNQVATVTVPDAKTIMLAPWDKTVLKAIEKAVIQADLGFSPVNDGEVIRIPMPPMSEDNRKDLVKIVGKKTEHSRIAIRQLRDKVKDLVLDAEKEKELSEDERFKYLKQLDDYCTDKVKELNAMAEAKEEQIMKV